ncbi:peptidase M1-like protein [Taibaiella chishuiensis]|uniref:Peptidase M1-like protein n=1 Tax=Taibaiella chishuiensis TaxID=1434707 RepID=A0A2P8D1H3_9BACT|nr:peptidase M1-like protein [Taibaiella chishuiensis]
MVPVLYRYCLVIICVLLAGFTTVAQPNSVMCSNTPARAWWDVQAYELDIVFDTATNSISGSNTLLAKVVAPAADSLQLDLQEALQIDSVLMAGKRLQVRGQGSTYYLSEGFAGMAPGDSFRCTIYYHGAPVMAQRAPWDGGLVRTTDGKGQLWMAMACQGSGAYMWFPCKNFNGDEPERVTLKYTVPSGLTAIGNGRLRGKVTTGNTTTYTWSVQNPINNYDITFYIGDYTHWSDTFAGAKGPLSLDYYVLRENEQKARKQFAVVKPMMACFEEKMGPYPFYEDGYKLVDAPYLGMEHQSAVAYGNEYKMGYLGRDRSKTGVGLTFDFIIIHESGHEWFGNSITAYDPADTWIQEGFTSYSETIFAECLEGKQASFRYQQGKKRIIRNDKPVQGQYNACDEGSGDHYDKGAFVIHMIRMIMDDDTRFFAMLKAISAKFYHQLVTSNDIETFINQYSGKDFSKLFEQYLRHKELPVLLRQTTATGTAFQWSNCIPGFDMPLRILLPGNKATWIYPVAGKWTGYAHKGKIKADPDFLVGDTPGKPANQ